MTRARTWTSPSSPSSSAERGALLRQLGADVQFLSSHRLLGYALVIGVRPHHRSPAGQGVMPEVLVSPVTQEEYWLWLVDLVALPVRERAAEGYSERP